MRDNSHKRAHGFRRATQIPVDIVSVVGEHVRLRNGPALTVTWGCARSTPRRRLPSPSTSVHQFYKCFSCGAGGDVFKFVRRSRGSVSTKPSRTRPNATASPCPSGRGTPTRIPSSRGGLPDARAGRGELSRPIWTQPAGEAARSYLARRGVAPETIEQFGLGYSDRSGRALLRLLEQHGFTVGADGRVGPGGQARGRQLLRPFPQPADVSHSQRNRARSSASAGARWPPRTSPST